MEYTRSPLAKLVLVTVLALAGVITLAVAGTVLVFVSQSSLRAFFLTRTTVLALLWTTITVACGSAFIIIWLLHTADRIQSHLKLANETDSYAHRFNAAAGGVLQGLIIEINGLLERLEQKEQRIAEMNTIIDDREQENQLLWLEIEHSLCLAREEAERDSLTGLFNRKSLEERFSAELEKASKRGGSLSVLMADLDHFKRVNDTFGHQVGDEVLRVFAETVRNVTRIDDVAGRYGGEEFVIVLPDTSVDHALAVALRIKDEFSATVSADISQLAGTRCTVSFGVADFPICARDKTKLISAADLALLKAKQSGRDAVVYYGEVPAVRKRTA